MPSPARIAFSFLVFCLAFLIRIEGITVDNSVQGDPLVECGGGEIGLDVATEKQFGGHVFVKSRFAEPACRSSANSTSRVASIRLGFDDCGIQKRRSANPRGIFLSVTLIVTFHSSFITKNDRAYQIQCYYMEKEMEKVTEIEVSMLTTTFQTQQVIMPICRYEVLSGGPDGPRALYVRIGEQVYHKWTCDTETIDVFCMIVHSCRVDDGGGDRVHLLDEQGCAIDKYLLGNLDYPMDLMAGKEAHVFKYADRPSLFFDCQIMITIKEPGQDCPVPQCSELQRGKRQLSYDRIQFEPFEGDGRNTVSNQAVDVNRDLNSNDHIGVVESTIELLNRRYSSNSDGEFLKNSAEICLDSVGFISYGFVNVLLLFLSGVMIMFSVKIGFNSKGSQDV